MKDPCNDGCLVKACCTQLCDKKKNYNTLLDVGYNQYRNHSLGKKYIETEIDTQKILTRVEKNV